MHNYYPFTPLKPDLEFIAALSCVHIYHLQTEQDKLLAFKACRICFLLLAEQERGASGWAVQPEGE